MEDLIWTTHEDMKTRNASELIYDIKTSERGQSIFFYIYKVIHIHSPAHSG